jgi:phage-related tail protein
MEGIVMAWIAALIGAIVQDISSHAVKVHNVKQQQKDAKKAFDKATEQYNTQYEDTKLNYERQSELNQSRFNLAGKGYDQSKSSSVQSLEDDRAQTKSEWGSYLWGQKRDAGDAERAHDIKRIQRRGL